MSEEVVTSQESGPVESGNAATEQAVSPISFAGGGDNANAEQDAPQDWRQSLPEEYRESSWATKYQTPEEFYKGVDNMAKLVGKKSEGVTMPGDDATPEQWEEFYNGIGRPESPNGYKITLPEENAQYFQDGDVERITDMFHKSGLNTKQAQALTEQYLDWQKSKLGEIGEAVQQQRQAAETALKEDWGDAYDDNVKAAYRGAKAAGVLDELEKAGLGDNPAVLKLAELAGRSLSEDGQRDGSQFSKAISKAQAEAELSQITMDPNFRRDPVKSARVSELMDAIGVDSHGEGSASATFSAF